MVAFINEGIALGKVVILQMEAQVEDQTNPSSCFFFMKDLKKLYQEKLSYLEALPDFIDNVHVT